VKAYSGTDDDANTLRKESMCLEEGQYEFTIYDSYGDGLLIDDVYYDNIYVPAHYNVTSYGELIVEGAEFDHSEATSFSLPLPSAPSATPSISFNPSMSPSSSAHPSESFAPSMSQSPSTSPSTSPSQLPSISTSPSAHPSESSAPSMLPSAPPSTHPSASFSPTETCYWIDVSVVFD